MTIDDLLEEIAGRGWYMYALRNSPNHPHGHEWSVYLRLPEVGDFEDENYTPPKLAYGQGSTPHEAILMAMETKVFEYQATINYQIAPSDIHLSIFDKANLRKALGLQSQPIKRRV